mmetsp:Transcript_19233/g.17054  ORF Transcript_19233/g.17054 Transcript_19233/m.17054 type:complete len:168 (-) Transcript_19233:217-720(-)
MLSDRLNPSKEHRYCNPNRYRSLGATIKPIKKTDPLKDKPKEKVNELPIAEMIMQKIERINVTSGVWQKLCKDHLKINDEITQTHVNETKGPDLSIAALKKERFKYRASQNSAQQSPRGQSQLFTTKLNNRPSTMGRAQTSRKIRRNKCFFKEKNYEETNFANLNSN